MKQIPLTQGKFAIVDDEDYDFLMQWKWQVRANRYAGRTKNGPKVNGKRTGKTVYMHREIISVPPDLDVDHINADTLDNRKENLRSVTTQENVRRKSKSSGRSSKYKGVHWATRQEKWLAKIQLTDRTIHLGTFESEVSAASAYNKAAEKHFGEFAKLNILDSNA